MRKRLYSLVLAIIIVLSAYTLSSAAEAPAVIVESLGATGGSDVSVKVTVENNPGLWGMDLRIDYDKSAMTLTSVENGDFFATSEWTRGNLEADTYILSYEANEIEDITKSSGTLATLNFTLKEDISEGDYEIKVSYRTGDIINISFEDLAFTMVNGKVTVAGDSGVLKGDLNNDGQINMKDIIILRKIVAGILSPTDIQLRSGDLNGDGNLNMKDIIILRKKVAGVI